MEALPPISKEFLEEALNRKIESFTMKPGTNVGDNYMSVLYSFEVEVQKEGDNNNKSETLHILSKCYPAHPARQTFLNTSNVFWNELSIYKVLIPEFESFANKFGLGDKKLFPPLIGGKAIDFEELKRLGDKTYDGKVFDSFDLYIMMTDLRKTWGFRMADRRKGLNFDEMKLVISAQAKLHALSWGYKQLNNSKTLSDKFDFLEFRFTDEDKVMWGNLMEANIQLAADTVEGVVGKDSIVGAQIQKVKKNVSDIMEIAFTNNATEQKFYDSHRLPPTEKINEEPWRVLLHGDCWTNNLLFRYDEKTGKPLEVILVDLQMMREHCPTMDLAYLCYCSTTTEFRREHLNSILELYHDQFASHCQKMGVPALPGFSLEELKRRFHRAKILGFFMATMGLPIMLKDAKDIVDMETVEATDLADLFENFISVKENNTNDLYTRRMVATALELHEDGVL